jgi:hypothetical protein
MLERVGGPAGFLAPAPSSTPGLIGPYTPVGTQPVITTPKVCDVYTFITDCVNADTLNFPNLSGEAIDLVGMTPPAQDALQPPGIYLFPPEQFFEVELNIAQAVRSDYVSMVASLHGWTRQDVYPVPIVGKVRIVETFRGLRVNSIQLVALPLQRIIAMFQLHVWHARPDSVGSLAP